MPWELCLGGLLLGALKTLENRVRDPPPRHRESIARKS